MTPTTFPDRPRLPILLLASLSAILLAAATPERVVVIGPVEGLYIFPLPDTVAAGLSNDAAYRAELKKKSVTPVPSAPVAAAPPAIRFLQILLVEENGTRRTIQAGGEAWLADTLTRRLVRTLAEEKMTRLRAALQTADVEHWAAGDATLARGRARLIVVLSSGQTHSVALASADAPALTIVALVRGATS